MTKKLQDLMQEANAEIETIPSEDAKALVGAEDVAFIDLRDGFELLRGGKIPGAVHVPRGSLEFAVDPDSPYHNEVFSSGKKIVLYCAGGGRSALAAKLVQEMGVADVAHIGDGYNGWKAAGGVTEDVEAE